MRAGRFNGTCIRGFIWELDDPMPVATLCFTESYIERRDENQYYMEMLNRRPPRTLLLNRRKRIS